MWVVVGLGNPGRRYDRTRHNVGFRVIDRLRARWDAGAERAVHGALVAETRRGRERVLLVKPQTHMNASGESVASLRRFYRVDQSHLVVVHDDADLEVGRVRIRTGGRAGGNRGISSLIDTLGSAEFLRVKVGVGRPDVGRVAADWVLAAPSADDAARLAAAEERAADGVDLILTHGPMHAMNHINQKEASHGGSPL